MIIRLVILFLLASVSTLVQGQYTSNNGRFSITENKGCDPFTVTINAPECNGSFSCSADFKGDGTFVTLFNGDKFTYTAAGTYKIKIVFATTGTDELDVSVVSNIQPEFDMYSCGGNGVQVKVTDTNYDEYVIDFNDGTIVTVPKSNPVSNHNYASAGAKTITVRGRNLNAEDNCNANTKAFDAIATIPTPFVNQLTVDDNAQATLDFVTQSNILYKLEIASNNGTTFQPLQNVYNTNAVTVSGLKTDDLYYCFRLAAYDPCNNITKYSNTICSANVDLAVLNNTNQLSWSTTSTGVNNYSIFKTPGISGSASPTATVYADQDIVCGTEYCYQLETNYTNGSRSLSLQKCGTAISHDIPPAVDNISVFISGNTVGSKWQPEASNGEYEIFRSMNGSLTSLGSTIATSITDTQYNNEGPACYKISFTDVCNNKSPISEEVCSIFLTASLNAENVVTLSWSAFNGWKNGVQNYAIEKYTADGQLVETIDVGTNTTYADANVDFTNQIYVYRIVASANELGLTSSISNAVNIVKNPNIFYPIAFTPNADGLNDSFIVFGQYVTKFEMKIFNRWGELMYITNDLTQGWDGTYKGARMPEGTYVFRAKITDQAGRTFDKSGTIVLLKK